MKPIEKIKTAIEKFEAVEWASCGYPLESGDDDEPVNAGWVKFELKQTKLGWRTLEFLAWVFDDMSRAGEPLSFFPTSPPPYLNEPGQCLSFVLECYPEDEAPAVRFSEVAQAIDQFREEYWAQCKGRLK